jgi:hypothetical protein
MKKYIIKSKGECSMKLSELLSTENEITDVAVEGKITLVFPPKTTKWGKQQFLLIADGDDTVAVQSKDTDITEADKGRTAKVTGGTWKSYTKGGETKHVLDVGNNIELVGEAPKFDTETAKTEIFNSYYDALIKSLELLSDDVLSGMLARCKEKGWTSENVTAVAASLYIELNKQKNQRRW